MASAETCTKRPRSPTTGLRAIEPMICQYDCKIFQSKDGWTVKTRDGKYAAHYENTILITAGEPEILTAPAP